ncbi:MAG: hypothetical protein MI725_13405, partial [Pirellulales bacterium]|nr:hypothetical protein [Pirellulales bacterium]
MLAFLPVLILLLTLAALEAAQRLRPDPRNYWMVASGGAGLAWLAALLLRARLPLAQASAFWQLEGAPALNIAWHLDTTAWALYLGLLTLLLARQLVGVGDFAGHDAYSWMPAIGLIALASLIAIAGNLLTLALCWLALDLALAAVDIRRLKRRQALRGFAIALFARLLSGLVLLWLAVREGNLPLAQLPAEAVLPLLLAAGLRLGLLPLNLALHPAIDDRHRDGALLSAVALLPGLALLPRIPAVVGATDNLLLVIVLASALFAAFKWLERQSLSQRLPHFLILSAALALGAAIQGAAAAALVWSLVALLGTALLSSLEHANSYKSYLLLISGLALSGLPFMPTFAAVTLYSASPLPLTLAFMLPHSILLLGWLRAIWDLRPSSRHLEQWRNGIYVAGLFLPLVSLILIGLALPLTASTNSNLAALWPVPAVALLSTAAYGLAARPSRFGLQRFAALAESFFSFAWL